MRMDVYFKLTIKGHGDDENPKELIDILKYMTDSDFRAKCEFDRADVFYGNKSCENCMFSDIIEVRDGPVISTCVFENGLKKDAWESTAQECEHYEPCPDKSIKREDFQ